MSCLYYTCAFTWLGARAFFLWHTDPDVDSEACADGVEVDGSGRILTFATETLSHQYAEKRRYDDVADPAIHYDLDALVQWCAAPNADTLDLTAALDAWNLFGDIPGEPEVINNFRTWDGRSGALYEKLLFGQNLPALTPPGEHYSPSWSVDELQELAHVLRLGLTAFTTQLLAHNA